MNENETPKADAVRPAIRSTEWLEDATARMDNTLKEWTQRVSETVAILRLWQGLEYTGHFIDVEAEMMERVKEVARRTDEILEEWGCSIKPPASSNDRTERSADNAGRSRPKESNGN